MKTRVLAAATFLLAATRVAAQGTVPKLFGMEADQAERSSAYVAAKVGAIVPEHSDLDGFDTGFAVDLALGYRFVPNLALELSIGYFGMSGSGSVYDPNTGLPMSITTDFTAVPLSLNLKPIVPLGRVELYGLVGASAYFVSIDATGSEPGYPDVHISDSDTSFGFQLGGGMSAFLAPHLSLGVELRYLVATATMFGGTSHFDSLIVGGTAAYDF